MKWHTIDSDISNEISSGTKNETKQKQKFNLFIKNTRYTMNETK